MSLDIVKLYIGTERMYTTDEIESNRDGTGLDDLYTEIYDIATGELNTDFTASVTATVNIAMTSEGLTPDSENYDDSLAGWVIGLLTDMLGSTDFFVSYFDVSDRNADAFKEYVDYEGPLYMLEWDEETKSNVYEQVGTTVKGDYAQYLGTDGMMHDYTADLYRTTMVEATFASGAIDLGIELEADLNLGALISSGIGGILFSDMRLAVTLGAPFNTTILEVYYLGSSRLVAKGNIYDLKAELKRGQTGAFSDAIYIDASGLGLGKIKFQGIAGLLGANVGHAYADENIASGAISAAEGDVTTTDSTGNVVSVTLGIDLAENYIGINIDKALINTVFGMLGETLEKAGIASLPDVQDLELVLAFGESTVESIELSTTLDAAGTGAIISISDIQLALEPAVDTEDLVGKVKTQFAGITYSKTAGVMTLLQSLIDGINPNLSINIDRRATSVVQGTSNATGTYLRGVKITTNSTLSIVSEFNHYKVGGDGMEALGGSTTLNDYAIRLDLSAQHPDLQDDRIMTGNVYFGNNNLMIADLGVSLGALDALGDLLGIFNWIDVGSVIGSGQLFPSFAYGDDRDTGSWDYGSPVATTASDGAEAGTSAEGDVYGDLKTDESGSVVITDSDDLTQSSSFSTRGAAATNVNRPYKYAVGDDGHWTSGYSYGGGDIMSILGGLINKVEVNLFNRNGYQPYISNMPTVNQDTTADTDASLISVKIELNKDAYNELLIFLYTTILSLFHVSIDANGDTSQVEIDGETHGVGASAYSHSEYWYFANYRALGDSSTYDGFMDQAGDVIRRHENTSNSKWVISNLFAELDSIDYMNISEHEKTVRRVQLLDPYVRSLPLSLLAWVLGDMVNLGEFGSVLLWQIGGLLGVGAVAHTLGDVSLLLSSLLPPFALYDSDAPNPSLNLYIDLDPQASFYGYDDGRTIAPGIQAIELMVNAEKYSGGGKTLNGINDSGAAVTNQTLYYQSINDHGTLQDGYALSINPRNLVDSSTNYSGDGLFELLEANKLRTSLDVAGYGITVDDVGTKHATVTKDGTNVATGTLNADLLVGTASSTCAGLPTTAGVSLIGVGSSKQHTVPITWDAGALDLSPSETAEPRLAGYVYGYALNLVVAAIPVYVTGDQAFVGAYEYDSGAAIDTIDWSATETAFEDDLVKIRFAANDNTYLFGTQMTDAEGNPLYAVLRNKDGTYETNNAGTYNTYPLYTALASMSGDVLEQVNLGGVDYYIIDAALSGGVLPVGTFSWDLNGLDYGWDGMNGNRKPSVTINYQWGYSATQSQVIELNVPSKLVEYGYDDDDNPTLNFSGAKIAYDNWGEFADKVGSLEGIEDYFKTTATTVSGTYVGSEEVFDELSVVDWDVTALVKAAKSRAGRVFAKKSCISPFTRAAPPSRAQEVCLSRRSSARRSIPAPL